MQTVSTFSLSSSNNGINRSNEGESLQLSTAEITSPMQEGAGVHRATQLKNQQQVQALLRGAGWGQHTPEGSGDHQGRLQRALFIQLWTLQHTDIYIEGFFYGPYRHIYLYGGTYRPYRHTYRYKYIYRGAFMNLTDTYIYMVACVDPTDT